LLDSDRRGGSRRRRHKEKMLHSTATYSHSVSRRHLGKARYHALNVLGLSVMGTKVVSVTGGQKQERSAAHGQKTGAQG
jgi:hypothetical protein